MRDRFSHWLAGDGIDLGPGHRPWPMPDTVSRVRLVDRWQPEENAALFRELVDPGFPVPDVVANLDSDRLSAFGSRSLDFVVASHVLEHLADPIGMLKEMRRVLRRGGVAVILLPDRRLTFDRDRPGTTLEHLLVDHRAGVTEVDDAHIVEVVTRLDGRAPNQETIEEHRKRSVHAHCWTLHEFGAVLAYVSGRPGRWTVLDQAEQGDEFGFVLRRRW